MTIVLYATQPQQPPATTVPAPLPLVSFSMHLVSLTSRSSSSSHFKHHEHNALTRTYHTTTLNPLSSLPDTYFLPRQQRKESLVRDSYDVSFKAVLKHLFLEIWGYYGSGRGGGHVPQFLMGIAERPAKDTYLGEAMFASQGCTYVSKEYAHSMAKKFFRGNDE
ncbi:hypothetical protein L1887_42919 [Cichorium endivia]|nr:hypothetical protein L1887_42919 [Cichorium endivia]